MTDHGILRIILCLFGTHMIIQLEAGPQALCHVDLRPVLGKIPSYTIVVEWNRLKNQDSLVISLNVYVGNGYLTEMKVRLRNARGCM